MKIRFVPNLHLLARATSLFTVEQKKVSIIIPTRDRPKDLVDLLLTVFDQNYLPFEVIIVDDSLARCTKQVFDCFSLQFKSISCKLKYVKGRGDGLPALCAMLRFSLNTKVELFL